MAKLKDILSNISDSVNAPELAEIAGSENFPDFDIDNEKFMPIKEKIGSLMTFDAALNNPKIVDSIKETIKPQIKKSVLNNIDDELLLNGRELFGDSVASAMADEKVNTYERVKKFAEATKKLISEGAKDVKLKEANEALKKQMEDVQNNFKKQLEEKDTALNELKSGYSQKLIDKQLENVIANYELGEKYTEPLFKKAIFDEVKGKVKKTAKLVLTDDMNIGIKHPENDELDLMINNKKVESLDDIISPIIEPFTKKASGKKLETDGKEPEYKNKEPVKMTSLAQDILKRKQQTSY